MREREDEAVRGGPTRPAGAPSAAARLGRLVRKELSEILRDLRTILTLVLMPLLLYPLLAMAFPQFLAGVEAGARSEVKIGVPVSRLGERFVTWRGQRLTESELAHWYLVEGTTPSALRLAGVVAAPAGGPLQAMPILLTWREADQTPLPLPPAYDPQQGGRPLPRFKVFEAQDLEEAVRSGQVDVGIRLRRPLPKGAALRHGRELPTNAGPFLDWELLYRPDSARAPEVLALLERLYVSADAHRLQPRPSRPAVPENAQTPRLLRRPLTVGPVSPDDSLARVVPLILILMTITGAVYPAIDLTAGERERGTLEILMAAPVPRLALLTAKYVAVLTVAVLTATVNLTMMTVTLQVSGLAAASGFLDLTPLKLLQLFGLLVLFAAFFSAVLLMLSSFARSFKEAQAYLIPLMLVSLAPGVLGMLPGLRLTGVYAVTPLLNIVLLGRDLLAGEAQVGTAAVVVFATLVYALAAIAGAARIFGAESVLYSEQGAWSDLFRRPAQASPAASAAGALLCLALLFPAYYFLAHGVLKGAGPSELVPLQVVLTLLLFVALPLAAAAWGRVRLGPAFRLRGARWTAFAAAVLLGAGLILPVFELLALFRQLGLTFLSDELRRQLQERVQQWRQLPAVAVAGAVAVMGAAEELFFRGYLFSALRRAGGARAAILGSAALFGLFHAASALDRLLPSVALGLVLGWVCWRAGSVLPGMVLHACYDAGAVLLAYYSPGGENDTGLSLVWVGAGVVVAALGGVLLGYGRRAEESEPAEALAPWVRDAS